MDAAAAKTDLCRWELFRVSKQTGWRLMKDSKSAAAATVFLG